MPQSRKLVLTGAGTLNKTYTLRVVGGDAMEPEREKKELTRAEREREEKQRDVMETGPFTKLAFDRGPLGRERVKMKANKFNRLRCMTAFLMIIGLLLFCAVLLLSYGTWELRAAGFDSEHLPGVARLSQAMFFPPAECTASGPGSSNEYNQIYAVLLLVIWTPATCIGTIVFPLWVISLLLGTELASDDVYDVMRQLQPTNIKQNFASGGHDKEAIDQNWKNWQRLVELPAAELVATMEYLSNWGVSMGFAIASCIAFSIGLLPTAVAMHSRGTMVVLIATATVLPGTIMCASRPPSLCSSSLITTHLS